MLLIWIIVFTLLGGVLSVIAAFSFLSLSEALRSKLLPHGVSFATGALLAVSFGGLIPHAFEEAGAEQIQLLSFTILIGLLAFFVLEKLLLWRHCHVGDCEAHIPPNDTAEKTAGTLILVGDGIHNFVDGILIAAAFLSDVKLGVVTSLAVAAHEIPQEVGDFAILLQAGYSRSKAMLFNILSSLTTVFGGVLAYFSLHALQSILPFILSLAASSFIYISVADLIPTLHKKTEITATLQQILLITVGVLLMTVVQGFSH